MKPFPLFLVLGLVLAGLAAAQWESLGPEGGEIRDIVQQYGTGSTLYAFTDSFPTRVLKSTDAGSTWTEVGSFDDRELSAAWGLNGCLYAGCAHAFAWSADQGATWTVQSVPNVYFNSLQTHLGVPNTVFGAGFRFSGGNWVMCYMVSTDSGQTWSYVNLGSPISYGECISISPANYNNIFVAGYNQAGQPLLYRSINGGTSFTNVTPSDALTEMYAYSVAVNPVTSTQVLFASAQNVYRSTDTGANWTKVTTYQGPNRAMQYSIDDPTLVVSGGYGCVYRSLDAGLTWSSTESPEWGDDLLVEYVLPHRTDSDIVYAGTDMGFYDSYDSGASWAVSNSGLRAGSVTSLHVAPAQPTTVYLGVHLLGLFKSVNSGTAWTLLSTPSPALYTSYYGVATSPADAGLVLAIDGSVNPGHTFRSTDGGSTWSTVDTYFMIAKDVIFDPSNPMICWNGGSRYSGGVLMSVGRSTNGGLTWTHQDISATGYYLEGLALDPQHPDTVYACGGVNTSGIYRTLDGGGSWTKISTPGIGGPVYAVAVSPVDPQTVFAASWAGIYRTTDFGTNWVKVSSTINQAYEVIIDPLDPSCVWVGTADQGVYQSLDGGTTWSEFNTGLTDPSVTHLAVNSLYYLFAGTDGGSAFRWMLGTGTEGGGVSPVPGTGISVLPNPVTGTQASISYSVSGDGPVALVVFDLSGRLVSRIDCGTPGPGTHQVSWNACDRSGTQLQPGLYLLRLSSDDATVTGRLVIAR